MPRPRPPWWLYLAAASFVGYFAFVAFSNNFPPEGFGATLAPRQDGVFVVAVAPGSPAHTTGVQPGDRQVASDGRPMRTDLDMRVLLAQRAVGRPSVMELERQGRRFTVTHVPARRVFVGVSGRDLYPRLFPSMTIALLVTLTLGLLVAFKRPDDRAALAGAWLLASIGCASAPLWLRGTAATWRALPLPLGALLWPACLSSILLGPIALALFSIFPRRAFRAPWILPLALLPGTAIAAWTGLYLFLMVYNPDRALGYYAPAWLTTSGVLSFPLYVFAGMIVLVWRYRRLEDVNERRRVRVLIVGAAAGAIGLLHAGLTLMFSDVPALTGFLLFLLFPSSFAYAIARHRLFDLRLIIRQGLQYALARGIVLSLVPVLAGVLVIDLLLHGDQPLIAIVRARGWIYVTLAAIAGVAHLQRHRWMEAIDRRFFRERFDARQLMRDVAENARAARSVEDAAPTVVTRVASALHPEFAALLVRDSGQTHYRTAAIAPAGHALPPFAGESRHAGLVRLLGKPLQVATAETGWLRAQLPPEDTGFLRAARIDLLVPIAISPGRREVLLALGRKQSEEPYGGEDLELLSAIAASLGLLVERPAPPLQERPAFGECPRCGRCYDAGVARCVDDGASLSTTAFDRRLAGRYALDRRLGRGGMGTVYEATDTALQRRVAVKVIREDLVGNADAADRFRREALAAAGFTHPHVVTVHDFGVTEESRAFLVMARLEGRTLREALRRDGRLSPRRAREILRGVCEAADAAHRRQLIHRDLKPENIFLAREGERETAKVLDFGIAKFLPASIQPTADTGTGVLVGTLQYMAPEQLAGGAPAPSWDLWALAIVCYEVLAGAHPFAGVHPVGWQQAVAAGRWTPINDHVPEATPQLQELFTRALAAEPSERPATAMRLFAEFEQALEAQS
jgi:serine/threonine-protein kinase